MLMRKFILLFMSMFLMVGTMVAQKDEDTNESAGFGISWMSPADEALETAVYNITIVFTKDISVAFPEAGIDIVNNETKEVVKITGIYKGDEYYPKNQVQFLFEQKMLPGKDGKEELQSLIIDTPGTYSFTIPAGCIESVDGEKFAEQTFTFSIVGTFEVMDWSPKEATEVSEVVVTFDREITEAKLPERGIEVLDDWYYTPVTKVQEIAIGDDRKSVTLKFETPVTTVGGYLVNLSQGTIISGEDINVGKSLWFTVIDTTPAFMTTYEDGDKVKELRSDFEITFKNVDKVELKQETLSVFLPNGGEAGGTATYIDNKIVVSFNTIFTAVGEYVFYIPAGMFTMDGVENEAREITVTLYSFEITPLEYIVTPEVGEVGSIERIVISFNQPVRLYYDETGRTYSTEIDLICGEQRHTLTWNSENWTQTVLEYLANAVYENNQYKTTPITETGEYTLNLADIHVFYGAEMITDQWGTYVGEYHANTKLEGTYTWTIGAGEGIKATEAADGEQAIYDLLGRRVEKITGAGIYIVNGKKMVVK